MRNILLRLQLFLIAGTLIADPATESTLQQVSTDIGQVELAIANLDTELQDLLDELETLVDEGNTFTEDILQEIQTISVEIFWLEILFDELQDVNEELNEHSSQGAGENDLASAIFAAITGREFEPLNGVSDLQTEQNDSATNNLISEMQTANAYLAQIAGTPSVDAGEQSNIDGIVADIEVADDPTTFTFDETLGELPDVSTLDLGIPGSIDTSTHEATIDGVVLAAEDEVTLSFWPSVQAKISYYQTEVLSALGLDPVEIGNYLSGLAAQADTLQWDLDLNGNTIHAGVDDNTTLASLLPIFKIGMTLLICWGMVSRTIRFIVPSD